MRWQKQPKKYAAGGYWRCRVKSRESVRQKQDARKAQVLEEKRQRGMKCVDCGETYPAFVLDFDHRDPADKAFQLARARSASAARIVAELAKCDLVCANCHPHQDVRLDRA